MKFDQNVRSETYLKNNAKELLSQVQETRNPVLITRNGEAAAVLQDVQSYEKTRQALLMLKLMAQAEDNIKKGQISPHDEIMARIAKRFKEGKSIDD